MNIKEILKKTPLQKWIKAYKQEKVDEQDLIDWLLQKNQEFVKSGETTVQLTKDQAWEFTQILEESKAMTPDEWVSSEGLAGMLGLCDKEPDFPKIYQEVLELEKVKAAKGVTPQPFWEVRGMALAKRFEMTGKKGLLSDRELQQYLQEMKGLELDENDFEQEREH